MSGAAETIRVALGPRSYDLEIDTGNLARLGEFAAQRGAPARAIVITDAIVEPLYAGAAAESLRGRGLRVDLLSVPAGERSKSVETADALWQQLAHLGADRKTAIVAVGGGVVGDLAGFVAATYARGLPFFQVPTTLLAQVDSSVGGKVGINLPGGKNLVGAFWQPRGVLIDTALLATLPEREYRAGLAEVVKYGAILDAEFFTYLERHVDELLARRPEVLRHAIARSCRLKADVVERDEREETGLRAVLNYGHTFCHAFETLTGYERLLHGEAVAMGIVCAARLSERLGRTDAELTRRQRDLLAALGLPVEPPSLGADEVLAVMARDKKAEQGRLRLVLPKRLGEVEVVPVDPAAVRGVLAGS